MVEGPGTHSRWIESEDERRERQIEICNGAPFYVLGPLVTDFAPGYDHITSCHRGRDSRAGHGAAMLCYVTPKEHLGLPNEREDVKQGLIAYKIARPTRPTSPAVAPAYEHRDDALVPGPVCVRLARAIPVVALDPETAQAYHDETLAAGHLQECPFLQHVRSQILLDENH